MILTFSIVNRDSFNSLRSRIDPFISVRPNGHFIFFLCGTKVDCAESREISPEEGQQLADELGASYFEVSAKINVNVEALFHAIIRALRAANGEVEEEKPKCSVS